MVGVRVVSDASAVSVLLPLMELKILGQEAWA